MAPGPALCLGGCWELAALLLGMLQRLQCFLSSEQAAKHGPCTLRFYKILVFLLHGVFVGPAHVRIPVAACRANKRTETLTSLLWETEAVASTVMRF